MPTISRSNFGESIYRVGQNHIYTVYIRSFWQKNRQIYSYIRCVYTVLANPKYLVATHPKPDILYLSDITPHKYRFLPCGVSAVTFNIYFL